MTFYIVIFIIDLYQSLNLRWSSLAKEEIAWSALQCLYHQIIFLLSLLCLKLFYDGHGDDKRFVILLEITKLCSKGGGILLIMIINSINIIILNAQVGGFHNWFHFYMLEAEGQIDYRGFMEHVRKLCRIKPKNLDNSIL